MWQKEGSMISVWVFDDVWDQGYKFIDALSGRYCFIPTIYASSSYEACQFLEFAFRKIPKHDGTSGELTAHILINSTALVINEKQFKL
jgi:hypothetical protein